MESTVHVAESQTTPVWTDEKHVHFLNSMEASFVTTMLHRYGRYGLNHHLRLDRHIPDTSDSTLDSIPRRRTKKHAPSDSMGPIRVRMGSRRTRRRSYQLHNSSSEQVVPQVENGREGATCVFGEDDNEQRSNV
ncbi:uncharacterized protein LOC133312395 [Gastrolobium bilobum]|uniref:uncharacterized protein LOC133312395 n=1 Tax=Gastrolobium bilobum TaxID=150636 RepID=UPI002AB18581|nr:uncharacterized protein LOC133312395 [Gastrolobium bilobum]